MKNIFKNALLFIAIGALLFVPANHARADGIDYAAVAATATTNGRYTATGIDNFTQKLKNQYIPTLLANITKNFTSATPTINI